jgi:murein DD-endopeptidase MepM/ murein hydrolase activator NlpD
MKRLVVALLAAGLVAGLAGRTAAADDWVVVTSGTAVLPSLTPNGPGLLVPPDLSSPPASPQQLTPEQLRPIWEAAAQAYGVPWQVLAAIDKVESNFGQNMGPSSAGAIGWMQFMPGTWLEYGTDADGDGVADPWNAQDAIYSAARYLAASGGRTDIQAAVYAYNHADWYVQEVLQLAAAYGNGESPFASFGSGDQAPVVQAVSTDAEEQAVADAEAALDEGVARVHQLEAAGRNVELDASNSDLLGDRLAAAQDAGQNAADLATVRGDVTDLRTRVEEAKAALAAAQRAAESVLVAPDGHAVAAPIAKDGWVFPVGGGPAIVSVLPSDASTTEIAAPAGTPAYALSDGQVAAASPDPAGTCGIGFTLQAPDGQAWSYCHLAYLDAAVTPGATLRAGDEVGLVGQTGAALRPELAVAPQNGAELRDAGWFTSLANSAFAWQSASAASPVFSVVGS